MTRKIIMDAVETRLRMITPYLDTWPQAMAIMALPQNSITSLKNLAQLVDEIWYYAGDRSVDVSLENVAFFCFVCFSFCCLVIMQP
jgi:ubiquinone biosynthesis protein COQ9